MRSKYSAASMAVINSSYTYFDIIMIKTQKIIYNNFKTEICRRDKKNLNASRVMYQFFFTFDNVDEVYI